MSAMYEWILVEGELLGLHGTGARGKRAVATVIFILETLPKEAREWGCAAVKEVPSNV